MTHLGRRLARLEAAQGNADGLIEHELSEEGKALLCETLAGLYSPEEIERIVSRKVLGPQSLSLAARKQLQEVVAALEVSPPVKCSQCLPGLRQP